VFREETGQSPAKAVERLRVEAARLSMKTTRHPIEVIARETGFGDRERNATGLFFVSSVNLPKPYSVHQPGSGCLFEKHDRIRTLFPRELRKSDDSWFPAILVGDWIEDGDSREAALVPCPRDLTNRGSREPISRLTPFRDTGFIRRTWPSVSLITSFARQAVRGRAQRARHSPSN